jgi:hypothetical protein
MLDKFLTGENVKVNGEIVGRRVITFQKLGYPFTEGKNKQGNR